MCEPARSYPVGADAGQPERADAGDGGRARVCLLLLAASIDAHVARSAGHRASAQVTAAVLLYRAVTYLPPIPLGAAAWLVWRHAPALIHRPRTALAR